jgi:deoxycytidylate deaminase
MRDKRLLHRVKVVASRNAFDRQNIGAVVADSERKAR